MNFGKAFTYIFDDPDWLSKLLGPVLFSLIPIVGTLTFSGYILDLIRNVSRNVQHPLPDLDIGGQLGRGFRWFLVQVVYALPFMLLALVMLPFFISLGNASENNSAAALPVIILVLVGALMAVYGLLLSLILPVAQANFANKDSFASGFNFGELFRMVGNNFGAWLFVLLGFIIAGFIAPLGSFLVLIGAVITSGYAQLMVSHLQGQAYTLSQSKAGSIQSY